jgi:alanine racemase
MSRPVLAQINLAAMRKNLRVAREKSVGAQLLA